MTDVDMAAVKRIYRESGSIEEVRRRLGITRDVARRVVRSLGPVKRKTIPRDKLAKLHKRGYSQAEIARKLMCEPSTVRSALLSLELIDEGKGNHPKPLLSEANIALRYGGRRYEDMRLKS